MPGFGTQLFWIVVVWLAVSTGSNLYNTFYAPRCPEEGPVQDCLRPLFAPSDKVDLFVFLTSRPALRWWTQLGFQELQQVPLWNATDLPFADIASAGSDGAIVPLSAERLRGVRRNTSFLHAHCFVVRSGKRLEDAISAARQVPDPGPPSGTLGVDAIHAAAPLTRLLPYVQRQERKSLWNSTDEAAGGEEVDPNAPVKKPPVHVEVPGLGRRALHPGEALMWVGAVFTVSAFGTPALSVAALRHCLVFGAFPWLLRLRNEQQEKYHALLRERQRESELSKASAEPATIMPHLVPVVRIVVGAEAEHYDVRMPPPLLYKEMVFEGSNPMPVGERDVRYRVIGKKGDRSYVHPVAIEHFGLQLRTWRVLDTNESKPDPEIPVQVEVAGMNRYSVVETLKQSLKMYMKVGFSERDLEDLQDFFFRYPLHILIIMQVIGFVQMLLTTMAFKNDISFFRGRSDYTGLSSRSLATDTLQEIIIFLYLYDYDDISRIVLFQVGTSSLIGAWKYIRVARLGIYWSYGLPWASHNRGTAGSTKEMDTEEIDARGMKYLKYVLYPLSGAWGLYNLYHYSYKSWWSWLVSSLADFAYTFGFINMMPQIFINYKLKSVAHMPWRVLMYKFFHTFIDDVFAFFIMSDHMTKKHRFMTLRDDIIFFVFLYQRHIYKVDKSRPDEFGFVYTDGDAAAVDDATGAKPAAAKPQAAVGDGDAKAEEAATPGEAAPAGEKGTATAAAAAAAAGASGRGQEEDEEEKAGGEGAEEAEVEDMEEKADEAKAAAADGSGEAGLRKRRPDGKEG